VCGGVGKMADAAAEMEEGGMVRTFKDLFAGAAGGIAQVLLGESDGSLSFLSQNPIINLLSTCLCCLISRVPKEAGKGQQVFLSSSLFIS
jgi:hypothetical protein